jgi:hypothetical protein
MKYGHLTGTKQERSGSTAWYATIEAANIQAVEDRERALVTALATQVGHAVTALPEAATRIARAATLTQQREIWPMSDGTWLVASQSDTELAHLVTRGPWTCDCKAATYQAGPCKHVWAVWLTIKLGATYKPSYN